MVAASLSLFEYYREEEKKAANAGNWKKRLAILLEQITGYKRRSSLKPIWLFVSLTRDYSNWNLSPYYFDLTEAPESFRQAAPEEMAEQFPALLKQSPQFLNKCMPVSNNLHLSEERCCHISAGDIAFIKWLIRENSYSTGYYGYSYHYMDKSSLDTQLSLLAQTDLPLFLKKTNNPAYSRLSLLSTPSKLSFMLTRSDDHTQMSLTIKNEGKKLSIEKGKTFQVI
ncbi:MAG: hypothetical protein D6732_17235, partial [Methanobacteriota archaeon]